MPDKFEITSRQFFAALDNYTKSVPGNVDQAMRRRMRILMQRVMADTPPFMVKKDETTGKYRTRFSNMDVSYDAGVAAIEKQLKRFMLVVTESQFNTYARGRTRGTIKLNTGKFDVQFDNTGGVSSQLHSSLRNSRGNIPSSVKLHVVATRGVFNALLEKLAADVGIAKSGWLPAFAALGGKSRAWIARHGMGNGSFDGNISHGSVKLRADNFARSIGSMDRRLVTAAMAAEQKAMVREVERSLVDSRVKARLAKEIAAA